MAPPGIELGLSDPEPSRAGLFGGHHVSKWLPAKHRRPHARGAMPGLARRNACKTLVESSARLSSPMIRRAAASMLDGSAPEVTDSVQVVNYGHSTRNVRTSRTIAHMYCQAELSTKAKARPVHATTPSPGVTDQPRFRPARRIRTQERGVPPGQSSVATASQSWRRVAASTRTRW